jgi:hypothetical protein
MKQATIKNRRQKDKEFAIVGRNFGSKKSGLHFWYLLPAHLRGSFSAGGKICLKNYLLSQKTVHFGRQI